MIKARLLPAVLLLSLAAALTGCSVIWGLEATPTPMVTVKPTLAPPAEPTATPQPKEIVQLLPYQDFDPNTDPVAARLAELTGYTLTYILLPQTGADEQLSIELAVGMEYDLVTLTPGQFHLLSGKGKLTALDSLLSHAPALAAVYSEDEWDTARPDEFLNGIPRFGPRFVDQGIVLDGTVAAQYGITAPLTPKDLRTVLETVKKETGLIPLTGSGYRNTAIMSGFGLNTRWQADDANRTFISWIETEGFEEYLTYMAGLYEDGLLDPGWKDNTAQSAADKQDAGEAFAAVRAWDDPAELPEGHSALVIQPLQKDGAITYGVSDAPVSYVAIPTSCADAERVMAYLELRAQADAVTAAVVGAQGVQYELEGGQYKPLAGFSDWENGWVFAIATPTADITNLWLCGVRENAGVYSVYAALNTGMESALTAEPVSYAPPVDAEERFADALDLAVDEFFAEILAGDKTVPKDYDDFVQRWKADGGRLIIDGYALWKYGSPADEQT